MLGIRRIKETEELAPGTVCLFSEGHACAFGVIARKEPWVELAAESGEFPHNLHLDEILKGEKPGYCIIVLGMLYKSDKYSRDDSQLGVLRPRRFVHYETCHPWSFERFQSLFVCDNLALLYSMLQLRMFKEYFESAKHDLQRLIWFFDGKKPVTCANPHGDYMDRIFERCIK